MRTNNSFEEIVAKLIAENPEGELAKLPMNGFEYQLLSLIGNNPPKTSSESAQVTMSLSNAIGAIIFTITNGSVRDSLELLKLCYDAQVEKTIRLGRK
jgi:hypothetical protein